MMLFVLSSSYSLSSVNAVISLWYWQVEMFVAVTSQSCHIINSNACR